MVIFAGDAGGVSGCTSAFMMEISPFPVRMWIVGASTADPTSPLNVLSFLLFLPSPSS